MLVLIAIAIWILISLLLIIAFSNLPGKTDSNHSAKKRTTLLIALYIYTACTLALIAFIISVIFDVLASA